ncbi:MAG: hypothetical protein QME77_10500 [bacterium]|nr:hypothetical protein [bacterium]
MKRALIYIMANGLLFWAMAGAGVGLASVAETAPKGFRPPAA